jgi:hypothetical protein
MSVLGIHDHPRINRDQNRVQQNLTPVSNAETTPDRSNPIQEISGDEESNFETTQGQVSSGSRKRSANNEWVLDKRRRIVTLQDINDMCNAYKRGQMSEDEKTKFCDLVLSSYTGSRTYNFLEKTMQLNAENEVLREFRSSIASEMGKDEQEDLLGHVKNLQEVLSESEKNRRQAIRQIDELNKELNTQRAKISELNQKSKSSEEEINKQKEKINSSDREYRELRGKYDQLKRNFQEVLERKEYYKDRTQSLKIEQKDLNDENIELNKLLAEREIEQKNLSDRNIELKRNFQEVLERKEYYKDRTQSLKTEQKNLNDKNIELNKLLAERDIELKISEYKDKIQNYRYECLSKNFANVYYQKNLKHVPEKLTDYQINVRREIYYFLQELNDKEEIIKKLKAVQKSLCKFLNAITLYKQNKSISGMLNKWGIESKQNIAIIDENLEKQNLRTKLNDLGEKIPDKVLLFTAYTARHNEYLSDFINNEVSGRKSDFFYDQVKEKVKLKIIDADRMTEKITSHINKEIEFVRELRGEKVIQDFFKQVSKVEYFEDIMEHVDTHLDGNYEAILRLKPYEYKK